MFANTFATNKEIDFLNIAIVANNKKGLDALCGAIALKELIKLSIPKEQKVAIDIFFFGPLPLGSEILKGDVKIKNKLGEKTLQLDIPLENLEKVLYENKPETKKFTLKLVGIKGKVPQKKEIKFVEIKDTFDLGVGLGFRDVKEFESHHPEIKNIKKKEVFNKDMLKAKSLTEGIMDLFYSEKVKPNKTASLAFFTYLSSNSATQ